METLITYTVKRKGSDYVWQFQYDLNGILAGFKVVDGGMSELQVDWLYKKGHFPYTRQIIDSWSTGQYKDAFEIVVLEADLSFEALWNLYDYKVKRKEAEKVFNKMKQADIIKAFIAIPGYKKFQARKKVAQAMLPTFLNQEYYNDEWDKIK